MICPICAADLSKYPLENDVHTHWCEECSTGLILKIENGNDRWITLEEAWGENGE